MNWEIFSGVWTAILIVLFLGIVVWAYSARRKTDFDKMSVLPLEDDQQPPEVKS